MIEMFVVLAFVLLLVPFAALYVIEWLARAGKGPLVDPDRMIVLDAGLVPVPLPALPAVASDDGPRQPRTPIDDEACDAESRIVAALLAGDLDPGRYRERMADLAAADAAVHPVRLPPAKPGT
jgi:hypothetical protein